MTLANEFKPHSAKQDLAVFSEKPLVVLGCGIQFGKTVTGAIKMKMAMHKYTDKSDNFLILAPTYKIMQQSTLPEFLKWMDGFGEYNKVDGIFRIHSGGTCYMRTATDPDSIVGVTDVRFIWGDEAGKYSLYFWENIQARAAFKQAQILLTTSPYTLNWIWKEIIRPIKKDPGVRPDVELIQARSDENPYFPKSVIELKKKTMDARRFNALFGGQWEKMEGLVYDCYDETENSCDPFTLPIGTKFYGGVDWGTTAPFALVVRAITPDGYHFQVSEYYKTGLTITDMIQIARQKKQTYGIEVFYCDPASPGYIEEFCRNGLTAVGANNNIRLGIDRHYELIKTRRYKTFRGMCRYTVDEYESYHYPDSDDNIEPNRDIKDRLPVKQDDHALDANRYISIETFHGHIVRPPHTNDEAKAKETPHENAARLFSPYSDESEDWS